MKPEEIKKGLECCAAQRDGRCEEYDECACCPYFAANPSDEDILALIQRLEDHIREVTKLVPKWISVDNPPQKEGEYIVTVQTTDGKKERLWDIFQPNHEWCEDGEGNKVLFWMSFDSLPEPPKEV